jgi:predicted PurR-regulated permease PerM
MKNTAPPFYNKLAYILICVVLSLFLLSAGKSIFIPIFFASLVCVLLYPVCLRLEKWGVKRGIAALLAVLLFIGCLAVFIYFFVTQVIIFTQDVPQLQQKVEDMFTNAQLYIAQEYHVNSTQQLAYVNKSASGFIATAANSLGNFFLNIVTVVIWTIFIFIYCYFMLSHRKLLLRFILSLFRPQNRAKAYDVVLQTRSVINSYVIGLLLEMAVMIVLNIGAFFIIGIRYAILLGLLASVLNIIPYLGIYTAMGIAMLITFTNGTGTQAVEVGIIMIVLHFIDANILLPRIVGGRVKMNPLVTIIAVLTGHLIWGIPGMFLFIPLTAILKIICTRVDDLRPWAILIGTEDKEP